MAHETTFKMERHIYLLHRLQSEEFTESSILHQLKSEIYESRSRNARYNNGSSSSATEV
jgi:hypothetical protein